MFCLLGDRVCFLFQAVKHGAHSVAGSWANESRPPLPSCTWCKGWSFSVGDIKGVLKSYMWRRGLGRDQLHPRQLASCCDKVLFLLFFSYRTRRASGPAQWIPSFSSSWPWARAGFSHVAAGLGALARAQRQELGCSGSQRASRCSFGNVDGAGSAQSAGGRVGGRARAGGRLCSVGHLQALRRSRLWLCFPCRLWGINASPCAEPRGASPERSMLGCSIALFLLQLVIIRKLDFKTGLSVEVDDKVTPRRKQKELFVSLLEARVAASCS